MIYDKQYVSIVYKTTNDKEEEENTVVVKEINETKGNYYIICYIPKLRRNKKIFINKIIKIQQQPKKNIEVNYLNSVIFTVTGRLASLYKLKPSENVIDFSNDHLTISNTSEDKDVLMRRLLKYGENCKIIKPESIRKEFIELTNKILANLEN